MSVRQLDESKANKFQVFHSHVRLGGGQVDLVDFAGPEFRHVDNRFAALTLVQKGLCDAALFSPAGATPFSDRTSIKGMQAMPPLSSAECSHGCMHSGAKRGSPDRRCATA